ncbi:MAG: C1 family peptidase [Bacteroidales bacterium]|nr:C1 family peptidase [Bacteroidales bacterium]
MKKRLLTLTVVAAAFAVNIAAEVGGIDADMLGRLKASFVNSPQDKALRNAMNGIEIDKLAANADAPNSFSTDFSDRVESKGITNQKNSGRCWLFTGQNVLRSQMMKKHDLPELYLSQNYNFFFDQLEKANLFLQAIINTADREESDRTVDWLFQHPLSDGGQYTGVSENFMKYGVIPAEVMRETNSSNNTTRINSLISLRLREDGLKLRRMKAEGMSQEALMKEKEEMLKTVYRMLALTMGEPPTEFTWTRKNSKGEVVSTKTYTPQSFYKEFAGQDLKNDYVMLMNDPSREFYKLYEIDLDRHAFDAGNWKFINLPVEDIKKMAISSIKDGKMMYFSCDVGKFLDRERGVLDVDNYDYESLFGTTFGMDKAERIRTHASASSHAMTLVAVDIDKDGKPTKWMVENSWGPGANDGHLIMTDKWFDEYMFRLVVDKKYVPAEILKILNQTPTLLPAWDPLYLDKD